MIDELEVVRRLGADSTAPDPEARERVRARVRGDRRPQPRRRRPWSVTFLAPAAAALLAVALVLVLSPGDDRQDFRGGRQAAAAPGLFPEPDQFLYVRSRTRFRTCGPSSRCPIGPERLREVWLSERHRGRIAERPGNNPRPTILGPVEPRIGNRRFTHEELVRYAPTGRELLTDLQDDRVPRQGDGGASYPFRQIADALSEAAMPARVRRAMLEALPLVPGVTPLGDTTDAEGRAGIGYARVVEGQREEIVVDPRTATLLEQRIVVAKAGAVRGLRAGALVGRATYLRRAVVDRAGQRP